MRSSEVGSDAIAYGTPEPFLLEPCVGKPVRRSSRSLRRESRLYKNEFKGPLLRWTLGQARGRPPRTGGNILARTPASRSSPASANEDAAESREASHGKAQSFSSNSLDSEHRTVVNLPANIGAADDPPDRRGVHTDPKSACARPCPEVWHARSPSAACLQESTLPPSSRRKNPSRVRQRWSCRPSPWMPWRSPG